MTTKPKNTSKKSKVSMRNKDNDRTFYLASLLDNISDALMSTDLEFKILEWNVAAENMYGWSAAEVLGQPLVDFINTEYLETTRDTVIQTILEKGIWRGEATQNRKDGARFPVTVSLSLVRDETGKAIGFVAINRDITERKQAEERIKLRNQRLTILREIDMAILAADSMENIIRAALIHVRELIDCQRANLTLIDRGTNELVIFEAKTAGQTSIPVGSRLPLVQFEDIIQTLSQNQPVLFSDYRTVADPRPGIQRLLKDGLLSTCSLPLFSQGSLIGMFSLHSEIPGFFDDDRIALGREVANQVAIAITQNRLMEGLRESEDRYHSFFQNSMDAILLTAPDGTIQAANPAACKMFGRTEAEICALGRSGLVDLNDPRLSTLLAERTQTGKSFGELTMLRKDGSPFPVEISSALFVDKYGNSRANMIIRDITERVLAEKQVTQMKRLYATLSQVNQSIVHIKSQDELFQSICDVAVKFGEFSLAWVGLLDEDTGDVSPVKATGLELSQWPFPIVNIYRGDLKNGLIAAALRTDKVKISEDMLTENSLQNLFDRFQQYGYRSAAAIPFRSRGKTIGIVSLASDKIGLFKAGEEVRLLEEMGLDISFALDTMENEKERRRAEVDLHESQELFQSLFNLSPVAYILARVSDYKVIDINEATENLLGYSKEEFIGKASTDIDIWADPGQRQKTIEMLLRDGQLRDFEVAYKTKSGRVGWAISCVNVFELAGEKYILSSFLDITPRKQVEEKAHYQAQLLENVNDAVIASDKKYIVTSWNAAAERMYGWKAEEVLGKRGVELLQTQFIGIDAEAMRSQIAQTGRFFGEATQLRKDGTRITVEVASIVLKDENGTITGYVSANRDITRRKMAEKDREQLTERLHLATRSSRMGIWDWDIQKNELKWDDQMYALYGLKPGEFGGAYNAWLRGVHPDDRDSSNAISEAAVRGEREYDTEFRVLWPDDTVHWLKANGQVFHDEHGIPFRMVGANYDITDRKQAEVLLRQSEAHLEEAQRIAHLGSWDWLAATDTPTWSRELCRILEVDPDQPVPSMAEQDRLYTPESMVRMRTSVEKTMRTGEPYEIELERVRADGSSRWLLARGERWLDEQGQLIGLRGTALDITEHKQAEKKISLQNQRLKILREIDTAILTSDSTENIVDAALSHTRQLIGCSRVSLVLIDSETNEAVIFSMKTVVEAAIQQGMRVPLRLFQDMFQPLSAGQNMVINDLNVLTDPPPQLQGLIKDSLQSLCLLPLVSQNRLMGFISLSSVLPGFFNEEIINLGREVANQVAIAITQNRLFEDLRNLNAKLEQRVTERTAELHQSNVELEHANHAKDEFLANMSHELRTPLNSILGLSETLLEQRRDPISEYQQRSLQIIHSSGSHLLELINDILDLSKIEAGKFDHYPQIISVSELCRSSLAFVKAQAVSKSIALTYQEGMDVSRVYADPRRLKQILVNLLTNAVKFTPIHGQVTLEVHSEPEQDRIHFSVIDTGIGIALEDLRQLFVPFKQVDSSLNRDYEGTGLGLALVQKLTDLHGGSVDVKSEVGRGSRFTINLPLAQAMLAQQEVDETGGERVLSEQAGKSNTPSDEPLDHGIVLLAEDNMANVLTISDYLESHGYEVVVAHDGLEAIEKAEETKPDIILMDIQMPALDGLEATRRLRANPSFASTPIIALTALAMRGDRERCLEAGANEYMSKPVGLKMLLSTVRNLLAKKSK